MYLSHINAYMLLSLQKSPYSPGKEEGVWGLEFNNGDGAQFVSNISRGNRGYK